MRISRTGLCLAGLYALPSLLCVGFALSITGDSKGRFVFLQSPLIPALAMLDALGLTSYLIEVPWSMAYLVLMPLQFGALYGLGALLGRLGSAADGRRRRSSARS